MAVSSYLKGIQHIGIPTKDLEATTAFYTSLGFVLKFEAKDADGKPVCRFLALGNMVIETYLSERVNAFPGSVDHITIDVSDIEAVRREISGAGTFTFGEPADITFLPFWENGCKFFKIVGPSGEIVEFCQIL